MKFIHIPIKFIPQLANRLIYEYSNNGGGIRKLMMGGGTTIVESLVNNRITFGYGINKIACLLAKAKHRNVKETCELIVRMRINSTLLM